MNGKVRKDGQTIQQLQNKLHQEKLKTRRVLDGHMSKSSGNSSACNDCLEFTMSMADPEHHGPFRYPDEFSEPTSTYSALNNFDLPICVDEGNLSWYGIESGTYWAEIHPDLDDTITYLTYEETGGFGRQTPIYCALDSNSNLFGLKPRQGSSAFYPSASRMALGPNELADLSLPWQTQDGVLQRNRITSAGIESLLLAKCLININWVAGPGGTDTSTIYVTYQSIGTPTTVNFVVTAGSSGTYQLVIPGSATNAGWGQHIFVQNVPLAGGTTVTFDIIGTAQMVGFAFESQDLADIATLRTDVEKYRVTAQSALVTYMGNVLTMAGQATALLYRGGIPCQFNQLYDYSTVGRHKHSYSGPMIDGSYAYWEPQDTGDMVFSSIFADNTFKRPYIICAGLVNQASSDPADFVGIIRLRVITHLEFTSRSQIFESLPSQVRPDLIVARAQVLRGVPNAMENGKHLDKLKAIGKKIFNGVKKTAQFLYTHKGEIEAAGAALAPLFL